MDIAAINSNLKCDSATAFSNKRMEEEYMIKLCNTSILETKSFEERAKEKYILSLLLDNILFLNYLDDCGKKVCNCDLTKIHNLK